MATLLLLKPSRLFRFPLWLIFVCVVTAGWLFVYAYPSFVREYYVIGSVEIAGETVRMLRRPNPERSIQNRLLLLSALSWLVLISVGRYQFNRLLRDKERENKKDQASGNTQ